MSSFMTSTHTRTCIRVLSYADKTPIYNLQLTLCIILFLKCQNPGRVPPATNSRLSPLKPEPVDYNYGFGATVDIPLDTSNVCIQLRLFKYSGFSFCFPFVMYCMYFARICCGFSNCDQFQH